MGNSPITTGRSAPPVSGRALQVSDDNYYIRLHLQAKSQAPNPRNGKNSLSPLMLLFARRGVLHPRHVTVFTANFIRPPTDGVAIWIVRV